MIIAKDFFNEVLDRLGWPQIDSIENPSLSARHRKILRLGARAIKTMGTLNDWPMLRTSADLLTVASETSDVTAGSEQYVTATEGSDLVTVDNKVFTDTYVGRAFQVSGNNYVYRIIAVPAPTQIQLHRAWIGDSLTSADEATFTIAMDRYALPDDFDRFADKAVNAFLPFAIEPVDPTTFAQERRGSGEIAVGEPSVFTVKGTNDGKTNQLVHFNVYPESQRLVTYDYQRVHPDITANNDKIMYPDTAIVLLIDAILEIANGDMEADDAKVTRVLERFMRGYNQNQANAGPAAKRIVLYPENDTRKQFRLGIARARVDYGADFFDRTEEPMP
jgi:hypothetical protein